MTTIPESIFEFDNSYARAVEELSTEWAATGAPDPEIIVFNETLAEDLGVDPDALQSEAGVALLAGNVDLTGPKPTAQVYAGHQFGGYSAQLGDGRALLLGEIVDASGDRRDIQLKGSGRTPFARGGDGKASLGPMLREFLVAEAMAVLDIPTTRALAVVATGEKVVRTGMEEGAILTRVAASHLRVGTFEYAARLRDRSVLKKLADYAIERHHPKAADSDEPYVALLDAVVEAQAELIAKWMLVGFIHGVMNTDNMTISGEGIDYGPCAFIDQFDPAAVFSSIDHAGRYAYGNQPSIAVWNLSRLAEALLPLIDKGDTDAAIALVRVPLESFMPRFQRHYDDGMRAKLGLVTSADDDSELFSGWLGLLKSQTIDYTNSFRGLSRWLQGDQEVLQSLFSDQNALAAWTKQWLARLADEDRDPETVADEMDEINPIYIPRNHLLDEALKAAEAGEMTPFGELLENVVDPFVEREGLERFAEPAPERFAQTFQTFCGT